MTLSEQCVSRRDPKCKVLKSAYGSVAREGCRLPGYGSCKPTISKLKNLCADRLRRPEGLKSNCALSCIWIIVTLLSLFAALHLGTSLTHGQLLSSAKIEGRRVSYFLGRNWRRLTGISSSNYTYPGLVPPYVNDSFCSVPSRADLDPQHGLVNQSANGPEFPLCLAVSIGDDGSRPQGKALPYQLVYTRLFGALKEEVEASRARSGDKNKEDVQVLVGVDFGSVVCKMLRDHAEEVPGMSAECRTFEELEAGTRCGLLVLGRSQRFVPQMSPLFSRAVEWKKRRSVDLDCPNPQHEPPAIPEKDWQPTVVTGFSSNHMAVGLLMLRSLGRAAKEGTSGLFNVSVVVYAMEVFLPEHQKLLDCVLDELNHEYNVRAEMRLFDFSAHPKWMRINQDLGYFGGTGEYAWKAIMVHTILRERGIAVWADAGDRFKDTDSLVETLKVLKATGFVSRKSHGTVWTRTHPLHLKFLRANLPGIWDQENCEAAIVGFTLKKYKEIARPWFECSTIRQCIAPDGSDRSNHRQDQAALTLLSILSRNPCEGAHNNFGHHLDDHPIDTAVTPGVYTTHCYVDPLRLDLPQGTHLDQAEHSGPYLWH
ncbi:hypothetical protein MARPO_0166s0002 [Marchantia polymorpha]|uniref:Uncharacterized protein n=1 Tax=Marchantia polymorpha TaxID=3197 RepID=A0A2R6W3G4_MARPO|nr:hypothetical protein MARPO_0166s0002 [Marchantia polymorpha]|eukprot:PTQ28342.1 hypothetical protein MARPO_0166s0002 [Marchantia polymorpha]